MEDYDILTETIEGIAKSNYPDRYWLNESGLDKNLEMLSQFEKDIMYAKADNSILNKVLIAVTIAMITFCILMAFKIGKESSTEEIKDNICVAAFDNTKDYLSCQQTKTLDDFYTMILKKVGSTSIDDNQIL